MRSNLCFSRLSSLGVAAVLLSIALPLSSQSHPAFEFFVVSGSSNDVPPMIVGTSDLEDSLNIEICDELTKGHTAVEIAGELRLPPATLQSHTDALVKAELLRRDASGNYSVTFPIIHREDVRWFDEIDKPLIEATVRSI